MSHGHPEPEMLYTGSGQGDIPLVYVTWSMFASSLAARGAARIELVAK